MALFIQFLNAIGWAMFGLGYFIQALSGSGWLNNIDWGAMISWFRSTPAVQAAPLLGPEGETLYAQYRQLMEAQFRVGELRRIILTLPALPDEGY